MSTYPVKFSQLEKENKCLKRRIDALERLLICYRLGRKASESLLKKLETTKIAMTKIKK